MADMQSPTPTPTQSCPLIVAQRIQTHGTWRSEHWNLAALKSPNDALVLEVVGNPNTYTYVPGMISNFSRLKDFRGGYLVGRIAEDQLSWLEERLRAIPVLRWEPGFDSQVWVFEALRLLKDEGIVTEDTNEKRIRAELKLEEERWNGWEDTLEERLFSTHDVDPPQQQE
ncbi:hypothetical protein FB45DRAFT_395101 [Roridomyces roridus]|uniref:Uncharacterized protein n=1 Tax=Roridomyces roridus TaxID=1738132 RepID=A0AAD7B1T5_9AGAR|nr:hypothetical protein FB45DRAFT_395101 [Roridomyces roridus]